MRARKKSKVDAKSKAKAKKAKGKRKSTVKGIALARARETREGMILGYRAYFKKQPLASRVKKWLRLNADKNRVKRRIKSSMALTTKNRLLDKLSEIYAQLEALEPLLPAQVTKNRKS